MMTPALQTQLLASAPLLVMAAGIVAVMLLLSVTRAHRTVVRLTTFIFIVGFGSCLLSLPSTEVTPLLVMDDYARFVMALLLVAGGLTALMVYGYLGEYAGYREEMYLLLLIATFGAMVLAGAQHAVSLLVGLETLGMALLGMIAYPMRRQRPLEASMKYLILSAAATAVMLFGFALVYAASGSMQFAGVAAALPTLVGDDALIAQTGLALVWAGFGFKLSLVPFHLWTADVYEGAPAPIAGYLATVSKGAVAIVLLRWLDAAPLSLTPMLSVVLTIMAVVSIVVGNLGAVQQNNVKRLLAYSSIAHFGYLMVPFLVGGDTAREAVLFYVAAYTIMTLGSFGAVAAISGTKALDDADHIYDFRGLFWRRPLVTSIFAPMLLAQAGVPLTVGFLAKFYILAAAVEQQAWGLALAVVFGSVIGLYYYLRLVIVQFLPKAGGMRRESVFSDMAVSEGVAMVLLLLALIFTGVWPQPLSEAVRLAVQGIT